VKCLTFWNMLNSVNKIIIEHTVITFVTSKLVAISQVTGVTFDKCLSDPDLFQSCDSFVIFRAL
jgi:hypothetical protein